ncbi:Putative ankyrin repeat protein MM_0045 [Geodia barretti]|uniref:Ankyrin repeat protein MM_0045 n=1 Tax=Geodia barretti TaxID=519541 RepID=A0AA35WHY7_GEOBA|nr:Putative ankyrin repeat protein MM_0045 [Geodia barretti]
MMAVRWGRTEVVSLLIEAGANIDLQNKDGDSAVIVATTLYNLSVLKELVRAGADLNLQNQEGLTALIISSRSGRTDITEILLSGDNIALDIQTSLLKLVKVPGKQQSDRIRSSGARVLRPDIDNRSSSFSECENEEEAIMLKTREDEVDKNVLQTITQKEVSRELQCCGVRKKEEKLFVELEGKKGTDATNRVMVVKVFPTMSRLKKLEWFTYLSPQSLTPLTPSSPKKDCNLRLELQFLLATTDTKKEALTVSILIYQAIEADHDDPTPKFPGNEMN